MVQVRLREKLEKLGQPTIPVLPVLRLNVGVFIEIGNLAGDAHHQVGRVKRLDRPDTADPCLRRFPKRFPPNPVGTDSADSRDRNPLAHETRMVA